MGIGGPDPSEWTNSAFIKKFGVPDRQITGNELLSVDFRFSNQKEVMDESNRNNGRTTNPLNQQTYPKTILNIESGLDDTFLSKDIDVGDLDDTFLSSDEDEFDLNDTFLSSDKDEFDLDDTFLSEDIGDLLEYDVPELSVDEDATVSSGTSYSNKSPISSLKKVSS